MMLKAIGMVMIIAACGGVVGAKGLEKRQDSWGTKSSLGLSGKKICFMHTNLSLAMQKTAQFTQFPARLVFAVAARELGQRRASPPRAWLKGCRLCANRAHCSPKTLNYWPPGGSGRINASEQHKAWRLCKRSFHCSNKSPART